MEEGFEHGVLDNIVADVIDDRKSQAALLGGNHKALFKRIALQKEAAGYENCTIEPRQTSAEQSEEDRSYLKKNHALVHPLEHELLFTNNRVEEVHQDAQDNDSDQPYAEV